MLLGVCSRGYMWSENGGKGYLLSSGRNLTTLLSAVTWKVENMPDELNDLAKVISRQYGKSDVWFLADVGKIQEARSKLREWCKESEIDVLKFFCFIDDNA